MQINTEKNCFLPSADFQQRISADPLKIVRPEKVLGFGDKVLHKTSWE